MKKLKAAIRFACVLSCVMGMMLSTTADAKTSTRTIVRTPHRASAPNLKSLLNGLAVPTYVWPAATNKPKAVVLGLHGGCLHGRAFERLANTLAGRGYTFVSFDMRGYGKWYFNGFGSERDKTFHYDESIEDIKRIVARVHQAYPGTPVYALGESLGANVGTLVAADYPGLVDGVVAVSVASPKFFLSPRMVLNAAQVVTMPTSKLNTSPYLADRLSDDPNEISAHLTDPLSRDKQSVAELAKSMKMNSAGKKAGYRLPPMMPVLVIAGAQDRLSGSPDGTVRWFEELPVKDKEFCLLPDAGHLIVETKVIDPRVQAVLAQWLDTHSRDLVASRARNLQASRNLPTTRRAAVASTRTKFY